MTNGISTEERRDRDVKDYYFRKGKEIQTRFGLDRATVLLVFGNKGEGITDIEVRGHYKRTDYNGRGGKDK